MDVRYLNLVAQDLVAYEDSIATFKNLPTSDQIAALQILESMASQAGATAADLLADVSPTSTS